VSAGLPAALQDAIARFADDVAPQELALRAAALTDNYRGGAPSDTAVRNARDVAAYLTTRLPATYAAMTAALEAVRERAPSFAPKRLLDAGAGPGTASWAASEIWSFDSVTMLDRNPHLLSAARTLAQSNETLAHAEFVAADVAHAATTSDVLPSPLVGRGPMSDSGAVAGPSGAHSAAIAARTWAEGGSVSARSEVAETAFLQRYDLIVAGYTVAEIPTSARENALAKLWDVCRGVLVIVEPGTPRGFANVLACRSALLDWGARIVAPCPGNHPCPIVAPDWCHFAERLPRSRAHMRAKAASVPFEDEKFSYVAVARERIELTPAVARIIAPPHAGKPGIRLRLCTATGIGERIVLKRDKAAYKAVARKKWGDAL